MASSSQRQFFVFDPIDARVIYAKANGIFRTADAGNTWTRFFRACNRSRWATTTRQPASIAGGRRRLTSPRPWTADSRIVYLTLDSRLDVSAGGNWGENPAISGPPNGLWIDRVLSKATAPSTRRALLPMYPAGWQMAHRSPARPGQRDRWNAPAFSASPEDLRHLGWRKMKVGLPGFQGRPGARRQHSTPVAYVA